MRFLCGAAAICIAFSAAAQQRPIRDAARAILKRAVEAQSKIRMRGVRSVEQLEGPLQGRYVDYLLRDGLRTRITFPENAPNHDTIIIETPAWREEFNPRENVIRRMKGERAGSGMMLQRLFEVAKNGGARIQEFDAQPIAGRKAIGIAAVAPNGTAAARLWIDQATGLVLKAEHYAPDGTKRGGYEFTRVEYDPNIPPNAFSLPRKGVRVIDVGEPGVKVGWQIVAPTWIPDGMREAQRQSRMLNGREILMIHYKGPGMNMTVFQAPGTDAPMPPDRPKARIAFVSKKIGKIWVVVVGNLGRDVLQRVLNSVR